MLVSQILKTKPAGVITIAPEATVAEAAAILSEKRIGAVIVSSDGKKALGILSERDIVRELGRSGVSCLSSRVTELMTAKLVSCTGGDANMDAVVVVSAPPQQQRERVLARPGMTAERLDAILSRQMHDAEKRARAHFVVDTGRGLEPARTQVTEIIAVMRDPQRRPPRRLASLDGQTK